MTAPLNSVSITEGDLKKHLDQAQGLVDNVRWRHTQKPAHGMGAASLGVTVTDDVSLSGLIQAVTPSDKLYTDKELHTLRAVRRGLQIGLYMAENYRQRSGASSFDVASGTLSSTQKTELDEKMQTSAAVAQFVTVRYILHNMHALVSDNTFVGNMKADLHEMSLVTPMKGMQCLVFCLAENVRQYAGDSEDRLVATVVEYAETLQQEILNRKGSFKHTRFFTDLTYQLENSDFAISGFDLTDLTGSTSVEFNRIEFGQVVGNQDSKHFLFMDAKRRMCYDPVAQKNPFLELGGITPVFMGSGVPGTGKSMMIAAYATMLYDMCQALGIPFLFHPLPDNIIDSYQGNSAKNMLAWMKPLQDPSRIVWAPIDDAENILENRIHQGVSEGVKAAIGVFLRYTEGAYAINRGNSAIGVFTNIPEFIDPAVLSRIQARFPIAGARKVEDFLDQDQLWWSRLEKSEPGFIGMQHPKGYEYHTAQQRLVNLGQVSNDLTVPSQSRIKEAFDVAMALANPDEHMFFAHFYHAVQQSYPGFSSRDMRNIQSAVDLRIMDFDLPDEWFASRAPFADKSYDVKMGMILELRKANMSGLSFSEIRMQEANRYLDEMARIADAEFDREVAEGVKQVRKAEAVRNAVIMANVG